MVVLHAAGDYAIQPAAGGDPQGITFEQQIVDVVVGQSVQLPQLTAVIQVPEPVARAQPPSVVIGHDRADRRARQFWGNAPGGILAVAYQQALVGADEHARIVAPDAAHAGAGPVAGVVQMFLVVTDHRRQWPHSIQTLRIGADPQCVVGGLIEASDGAVDRVVEDQPLWSAAICTQLRDDRIAGADQYASVIESKQRGEIAALGQQLRDGPVSQHCAVCVELEQPASGRGDPQSFRAGL
uniref:hypothetical protein n=1 Tax=Xanthomonas albilineans TaxID=29447 RepID=UPI0027DC4BC7|nr:hypothetical protein [Xanthomonas albilineans]